MWFPHLLLITCYVGGAFGILGFLDDSEIFQGPLAQFLNRNRLAIRDRVRQQTGTTCTSTGGDSVQGSCMEKTTCLISGGRINLQSRQCGITSVCCTQQQRRCGSTSTTKVSVYSNPANMTSLTSCTHTVRLISRDVCQLRLDFEAFVLESPDTGTAQIVPVCSNDIFTVTPSLNTIPPLCGINTGQHIIVHTNGTQTQTIQLNMALANRVGSTLTSVPSWRIRITQLECPAERSILRRGNVLDKGQSSAFLDFPLLAPFDCLQYFTDIAGTFESFNFNNILGPYMARLDYAICFRKQPGYCGINFTPVNFVVGSTSTTPGFDTACTTDYLAIFNGISGGTRYSRFCNAQTAAIRDITPGPISIHFHSEATTSSYSGFRMTYRLLASC